MCINNKRTSVKLIDRAGERLLSTQMKVRLLRLGSSKAKPQGGKSGWWPFISASRVVIHASCETGNSWQGNKQLKAGYPCVAGHFCRLPKKH